MGQERKSFSFDNDTFAFVNETKWRYSVDPETGRQVSETRDPEPDFTLRCFGLVRAAKLFFHHAVFLPNSPALDEAQYVQRIRRVMNRNPRGDSRSVARIEFPGFASLREFSGVHEEALKQELPGVWRSYFQRGNWRMVLPVTKGHQQSAANQILRSVRRGELMGVHVYTFPELTINHALLAWSATETNGCVTINTYDPNIAEAPIELSFDREGSQFHLPATHYFKGGPVKAYGVYRNLIY